MLKPMLARGELHMIGATTLDDTASHEKDARWSAVPDRPVDEPDFEDPFRSCAGCANASSVPR